MLAKPVLMRSLLDKMEQEAKAKATPLSLAEFEMKRASFYRDRTRAGQALPGETISAIRLSRGALARPKFQKRTANKSPNNTPKKLSFTSVYGKHPAHAQL